MHEAEVIKALRLCSDHAFVCAFVLAIYLSVSLGSVFLALIGVLVTVLSCGPGTVIYLNVLQIDYLTEAHIFTFFLLSVVSAWYLTFMVDTWRFSERIT